MSIANMSQSNLDKSDMKPLYEKLIASVKKEQGVVLSENDFAQLLKHGRLYTITSDKKKFTSYQRVVDNKQDIVDGVTFITTSTDDNGRRMSVTVWSRRRGCLHLASENLPIFNGINLPALRNEYKGESWI